jgi:NAD(P)H-hydrate epimerase
MSGETAASVFRLSRAQVREVDRIAIEEFHVPGIVLMENASRAVAEVVWNKSIDGRGGKVLILCGGGNNGGDGLAAARHLHNRGADVRIGLLTDPQKYKGDALTNWRIIEAMRLPRDQATPATVRASAADVIVDAIFGTGLTEPPREPFGELVQAIAESNVHTIAVDLPSGMDCDTGKLLGHACVRAHQTVTFVAEKQGFANPASRSFTGEVIVADIGCPREAISLATRR